jgi:hypothetical protein
MVQRFAAEASQLDRPPSSPRLSDVTHVLARAVESLPHSPPARQLAQQIEAEARAMEGDTASVEHAKKSATLALQAVEGMVTPSGSKSERQRVLDQAHEAVSNLGAGAATGAWRAAVDEAYLGVARAMLIATGGGAMPDRDLPGLVARLSIEDTDEARLTGAQILYAMAGAFEALQHTGHTDDLRKQADELASAEPLDYSPRLKAALGIAVEALRSVEKRAPRPVLASLRAQAQAAVERISPQRPFALQRAAVQDAMRIIADALTVATAP